MFSSFLVERHCSVCKKLDRKFFVENNLRISEFENGDANKEDLFCSCSELKGSYFDSTALLRIIQTIVLVALFISSTSALFVVRNSSALNADVNSVISGYSNFKKNLHNLKSKEVQEQFAKQAISLDSSVSK